MENSTGLIGRPPYSVEPPRSAGVAGDPRLAAGLLLGYCLLGLGSYLWAFCSQRNGFLRLVDSIAAFYMCLASRRRGVQRLHNLLRLLILNDVLNTVTAAVLAIEFLGYSCRSTGTCSISFIVWFLSRYFGVLFHVLGALACVFLLYHPQRASRFYWVSTLVFVLLLVFVSCCLIIGLTGLYKQTLFGLGALVFGLALVIIVKYAVSAAPPSATMHVKPIVIVAMFTVLLAFAPAFVLYCLLNSSTSSQESEDTYLIAYTNAVFLTNFNVFMDGLLFYFILRMPVEEEEQHQVTLEEDAASSVVVM